MKILFTLILISLYNYQILQACRCTPSSDFCSTVMNQEGEISDRVSVVRVIVEQSSHKELVVRMTDFLGGFYPPSNTLKIIGGDGGNCLMEVNCFYVGDDLILAAKYYKDYDAYSLTLCGVPFLMVKGEMVSGRIAGKLKEIPYHKLGEVISCRPINPTRLNQRVAVFPTITQDVTNIAFNELHSNSISVAWDLVSIDGRLIQSTSLTEYSIQEKISVDLSNLPKGVYLLRIRNEGEDFVTHKIVKAN